MFCILKDDRVASDSHITCIYCQPKRTIKHCQSRPLVLWTLWKMKHDGMEMVLRQRYKDFYQHVLYLPLHSLSTFLDLLEYTWSGSVHLHSHLFLLPSRILVLVHLWSPPWHGHVHCNAVFHDRSCNQTKLCLTVYNSFFNSFAFANNAFE